MRSSRRVLAPVSLVAALFASGCGPTVDLTKGLQVQIVSTGWFDAGLVEGGQNKLLPTVSFTLKNLSDQSLPVLQLNALFYRVNETDEWGSGFMTVAGSEGLAPGATTRTVTIRSQLGYTGTEARADMLRNSQFVDARVKLFAKYGSVQWVLLVESPISRQLLTS
jgi:hypothetical protein